MPPISPKKAPLHLAALVALVALAGLTRPAHAADLNWKGYDWKLTDGGMAGVADGSSANISVDESGYLHLHIVKAGNTWTASELFTVQKLGFGTYQWQIEGPVDVFDKQVVLGLFPYGPAAGIGGDGTNEIDIEFSRWGQADGPNADFTDYPNSGNVIGETTFKFSLGGSTSSTARFTWNKDSIESSVLKGHQAIASEAELIKKWRYAPNDPGTNIPQQAMPLGINLWCFGAPPSDGQNVEIVIRDFQFIKEGDPLPGSGGMSGAGSGGMGTAGSANGGGGGATGGAANGGTQSGGAQSGGAPSAGGTSGGMSSAGTSPSGAPGSAGMSAGGAPGGGAASGGPPSTATGGTTSMGGAAQEDAGGCACRAARRESSASWLTALAGLAVLVARRKRFRQRVYWLK